MEIFEQWYEAIDNFGPDIVFVPWFQRFYTVCLHQKQGCSGREYINWMASNIDILICVEHCFFEKGKWIVGFSDPN